MEVCANDEELATDSSKLLIPANSRNDDYKYRRRASTKTRVIALFVLFCACVAVGITLGVVLPRVLKKESNGISDSVLGIYSSAAVATDGAQCAKIGKDVLQDGGSAVDAAIATLLCMGVVLPQSMGIGGGFLMTIYIKENRTAEVLDARETAPEFATEDMFDNETDASKYGGRSIAIPGEIHGLYMAYKKYGSLPWERLVQPAIDLCLNGFEVGEHLTIAAETILDRIKRDNNTGMLDLLINNKTNSLYKPGDKMKNIKLGETLTKISKSNTSDIFYKGQIADDLVKDIKEAGGIITKADLGNYTARWAERVQVELDNMTMYSCPPPGSGVLLAFMLNVLDIYDFQPFKTKEEEVLFYHRAIEAFKFAYAKRMEFEDSTSTKIKQLIDLLKNKTFASDVQKKIFDNQTSDDPTYYGFEKFAKTDHGTAHMSVVAPNGDAVSVTSTINLYYGSLVRSMSTGILLNDEMDDFSTDAPNSFGVPPTKANRIHPGRRPMSSMAPAIFVDRGGSVRLAIGGNGGTHITSGITLVTAKNLWLNKDIKEAIDEPRIHDQLFPPQTTYEKHFPKDMVEKLKELGHNMTELTGRGSVIIGIARGQDGRLYANSDYRKKGQVDGF